MSRLVTPPKPFSQTCLSISHLLNPPLRSPLYEGGKKKKQFEVHMRLCNGSFRMSHIALSIDPKNTQKLRKYV